MSSDKSVTLSVRVDSEAYAWLKGQAKAAGVPLATYCRYRLFAGYDPAEQERVLKEVSAVFAARKANEQEDLLTRLKRDELIKRAAKLGVLDRVKRYYDGMLGI